MSKIALSSNPLGTGTLTIASPNTDVDRTLTLPDNSGTLLSTTSTSVLPKGVPYFSASGSPISVAASTVTKLTPAIVAYDTAGCYNTSLGRFTPNIAGQYLFTFDAQIITAYTGGFISYLLRNGGANEISVMAGSTFLHSSVSKIFYMNGTTDYMECAVQQTSGAAQNVSVVSFQGVLVRAD